MSNRHRAEVIEVLDGGAAVRFTSGRVEFVLRRGLVPAFYVGQRGTVDYVRSTNGYEWAFTPNHAKKGVTQMSKQATVSKVHQGDRVTCKRADRPYSSSAYDWKSSGRAMFEPGMHGEVIKLDVPCVRGLMCGECGKRHQTFVLVEFKWSAKSAWMPGAWDRVGLMPCNVKQI